MENWFPIFDTVDVFGFGLRLNVAKKVTKQ